MSFRFLTILAVALAVVVCAVVTYPLTRLRGHYFAIATVAIWMIAGILLYVVLRSRSAETIERVGDVMVDS